MRWLSSNRAWVFLSIVVITVGVLHIFAIGNELVADDVWFADVLRERSLVDFIFWRYDSWSGRVPLEVLLILCVKNIWLWKLANTFMLLMLCYAAGQIASSGFEEGGTVINDRQGAPESTCLAFVLFMLISPPTLYAAAWWITGSVNYLWPVALGLYGMLPLIEERARGVSGRIAYILCSSLAMYNEQVALVLLPVSIVLLVMRVAHRGNWHWALIHVAFMAMNACIVFSAPGSYRRYLSETALRFPDFRSLDVFDKLAIGFGLISRSVLDASNLMIAVLVGAATLLVFKAPLRRYAKAVVCAGLCSVALGWHFSLLDPVALKIDGGSASSRSVYLASAWSVYAVSSVVAACTVVVSSSVCVRFVSAVFLLFGVASVGALGFSPTAYASGDRIEFVAQIAFLLVALRILPLIKREFGHLAGNGIYAIAGLLSCWRIIRLFTL